MDLHLKIDDDLSGAIEIDLHTATDTTSTAIHLECRRVAYDEIGGEAFNANRHHSRHVIKQETLDELEGLLPSGLLTTPSDTLCALDGTAFTLTIGRGPNAVEYSWCSPPPAEYECLRAITRLLVSAAGLDGHVAL